MEDNLAEDGNRLWNAESPGENDIGIFQRTEKRAINPSGTLFGAECKVGMKIIVIVNKSGDNAGFTVYSQDRTIPIYVFAFIFAAVVCLIGGKKGIYAVLSLVFAFVCIIWLMFPLMYQGISPIFLTIIVAVLTTIITLGLLGGISEKTVAAILGTAIGVIIAAVAAIIFGKAAGITGFNVSDIEALNYVGQIRKLKSENCFSPVLLFQHWEQSWTLECLSHQPYRKYMRQIRRYRWKQLFLSGINVGRDMMGTMTNTLIFAYVGGAMTTLVLNYAYDLSYLQLANSYVIGIEIMQGLSGSLGVVLTVPVTAFIAAFLIGRKGKNELTCEK